MLFQVALDYVTYEKALRIAEAVWRYVDILEAGTTIIIPEGLKLVRELKNRYPSKTILADVKLLAGAKYISEACFKAGADVIVTQAVADDSVIETSIRVAKKYNGKVMIDLMGIKREDKIKRAKETVKMGAAIICLHSDTPVFTNDAVYVETLTQLQEEVSVPIAVAGGINLQNIGLLLNYKPSIFILGSSITKAEDPRKAAETFSRKINELTKLNQILPSN